MKACCVLVIASVVAFAQQTPAIKTFENDLKEYVKVRNKLKEGVPKLSKDSTPEQIEAYQKMLAESLRNSRKGAKRGDLFSPEISAHIRRTLKNEFQGGDRKDIREIGVETELQGVVLRVNYPYAQGAELSEMPPTLLMKLPQLPSELRYRFVGSNLILVDPESNIIIDFMPDAMP